MTMTAIGGRVYIPHYFSRPGGYVNFGGAHTIDASGEKHAVIFSVPKTGNISHLLFRTTAVSNSQTLRVGLQTVDATTGFPTGSAYGSMVAGTQASPAANTLYEVALGTAASSTVGDKVAMVIEFDSTAGNVQLSMAAGIRDLNQGLPYGALYTTSWADQADLNQTPIIGVKYDDGSYEFVGGFIGETVTSPSFNNTSTPDEQGNKITLGVPIRVVGLWCIAHPNSGDFDLVLYNSSNSAIATASFDKDIFAGSGMRLITGFVAPVTLTAGTYRLVFKPTTATSIDVTYYSVDSNAQLDCNLPGADMVRTHRTDAGSWTDVDTEQFPHIGLVIDQVDDGAGGGAGMVVHPGMAGGMRG